MCAAKAALQTKTKENCLLFVIKFNNMFETHLGEFDALLALIESL